MRHLKSKNDITYISVLRSNHILRN